MSGTTLALLRIRIQVHHSANRLHLVVSDLKSQQVTVKFERTLHVADADCYVRNSVHWIAPSIILVVDPSPASLCPSPAILPERVRERVLSEDCSSLAGRLEPLVELHDRAVGVFEQRRQYLAARRFAIGDRVGFRRRQQNLDTRSLKFFEPFAQVIDPERKMM